MIPYYEHSGITIYHGDCRALLPTLGSVDLVCTDPPYGIGEARSKNRSRGGRTGFDGKRRTQIIPARDYGDAAWDDKTPSSWIFDLMREISRHQIIFGGNYFPLPPSKCWLVWDKENGTTCFADCELAWTNFDKAVRRLKWRWSGLLQENMDNKEVRVHPTQKPVSVMMWAIKHAPDDCAVILDPFMGSGTTLVAAKRLGRTTIGIEREERYCEAAATRLSQEMLSFPAIEEIGI